MKEIRVKLLALLVVWIAMLASYSNSFDIGFQFDDIHTIQANPYVRSPGNIPKYFSDPKTTSFRPENSGYRPMTTTALAVGYAIAPENFWGYHLVKLFEHGVVATLIFLLSLRLLCRRREAGSAYDALGATEPPRKTDLASSLVAFSAALTFAVHRVNTEVVDYISAISSLQAGMFFLLAFFLYVRSREARTSGGRRAFFMFSCVSFAASVFSKEEGATFPAAVLLYEWLYGGGSVSGRAGQTFWQRFPGAPRPPLRTIFQTIARILQTIARLLRSNLLTIAPYLAILAAFLILRTVLMDPIADTSRGATARWIYFITQLRAWLHYWALYFWPVRLNADNLGFELSPGLADLRVWGALTAHVAIGSLAWIFRRRDPFAIFAVAWMYVTVLPASSVFQLSEAVNEHRAYIPYMMLAPLAAWALFGAVSWVGSRLRFSERIGAMVYLGVIILASAALGVGAYARNEVWKSDVTLWEDVLAKNPGSVRAMSVLGVSYLNRGETRRALALFERCHADAPAYLPCIVHLSMAYADTKEFGKGLDLLRQGYRLDPDYPHVNFHLGIYYKEYIRDVERAKIHFRRVESLTSGRFFQATLKLAEIEMEEGRVDDAISTAKRVIALDAGNGDAWELIGRCALLRGDGPSAQRIFSRLLAIEPNSPRNLLDFANLAERSGDWRTAGAYYQRATIENPRAIQAWQGLARAAKALGNPPTTAPNASQTIARATAAVERLKAGRAWTWYASMFLSGEKPGQIEP
ncbi:MAG: tetratricopeptide repeat protein [Deltaproteobacteria bacterium]|nr:tetratricopeptide repeat protein [Deltaproteobacteria bacterium]